jgi:signal transduction histidine kinase
LTKKLTNERADLLALNDSKDEFISLASHQLRTPATGVKQYIGMLMEGFAGTVTPKQRDMLERAFESNERQLQIISDLLNIARIDSGKVVLEKSRTNLNALLNDVVHEQSSKFRSRGQSIQFKSPPKPTYAQVDYKRLRMVFENLLDNASKYSPPNTIISLQIKEVFWGIQISVKDQGVGIARKDIAKLFQKFSRIKNPLSQQVGGSGLGLYWVKRVIDLHRGSVEVSSRLNKGTTFVVSLPKRGFKHE